MILILKFEISSIFSETPLFEKSSIFSEEFLSDSSIFSLCDEAPKKLASSHSCVRIANYPNRCYCEVAEVTIFSEKNTEKIKKEKKVRKIEKMKSQ